MLFRSNSNFKVTGTFFNPGPFGIYIAALLPPVYMLLINKGRHIAPLTILFATGMFFVLYSFSRSAWMGLLIGMSIIVMINNKWLFSRVKGKRPLLRGIFIAGILLPVSWWLFSLKEASGAGRILIWRSSWLLVKRHFFTGVGPGKFAVNYADCQSDFLRTCNNTYFKYLAGDVRYAFNDFLQVFAESGLIGIVSYLIIVFLILKLLLKQVNGNDKRLNKFFALGLVGSFVVIISSGCTSYPMQMAPVYTLFWLFAGVVVSLDGYPGTVISFKTTSLGFAGLTFFFLFLLIASGWYLLLQINSYNNWDRLKKETDTKKWEKISAGNFILKENTVFLCDMAGRYMTNKMYREARVCYKAAESLSPDKRINYAAAHCDTQSGYYNDAIAQYETLVGRYPNLLQPRYELAVLFYNTGELMAFRYWAKEVLDFTPKFNSSETVSMKDDINFKLKNSSAK